MALVTAVLLPGLFPRRGPADRCGSEGAGAWQSVTEQGGSGVAGSSAGTLQLPSAGSRYTRHLPAMGGWGLQVTQSQNCTTDSSESHLPLAFSLIHCPSCPVLWCHRNDHRNAFRAVSFNISTPTWLVSFMNQMLPLLPSGVFSFSVPICSKWSVQCPCHFIIMLFQKCHLTYQYNLRQCIFSYSSSNFGSYKIHFWLLILLLIFPNENWILHIGIFSFTLPVIWVSQEFLLCYIPEICILGINILVQNFFTLPVHYCKWRKLLEKNTNLPNPSTVMSVRISKSHCLKGSDIN